MQVTVIPRNYLKKEINDQLSKAEVNPKAMTALYLGITSVLSLCAGMLPSVSLFDLGMSMTQNPLDALVIAGTFFSIFTTLISTVLTVGYTLYCMELRRGQRVEYMGLFDGFSMAGSIIRLTIRQFFYTWLWSMLFVIPGIVAAYRYRYSMLNLCQHPDCSPRQAMELSKVQTMGYKSQLLMLDLSFLGWGMLSQLPALIFSGIWFPVPLDVPYWLLSVACAVWSIAVAIHYLPMYQTMEVAFFDISREGCDIQYVPEEEKELPF